MVSTFAGICRFLLNVKLAPGNYPEAFMVIVYISIEIETRENYRFLGLTWDGADNKAGWSIVSLIVSSFHAFFMFHAI